MVETTEKLMEQVNELMNICLAQMSPMEMITETPEDALKALKLSIEIMKTSKELALKQAEAIEDQNEKLNKIIRLLEKRA